MTVIAAGTRRRQPFQNLFDRTFVALPCGATAMRAYARSLLSALTLFGAFCFGAQAEPAGVDIDSDVLNSVPPETVARVSAFLKRFVAPDKSPSEQLSMFADSVEYYDRGIVGKEEIRRDMERYRRQWPLREYRVSQIDLIFADPQSDRVYVRYEVEFTVANPARARTISGRGMYGAVIADIDGSPHVASIQESVIARKRSTNPDR